MLYSSVLPQQKKMGGVRKVEKVPPPYYCTSAGHHVLGKKCVFIPGSFLKKSVFKAGTTVDIISIFACFRIYLFVLAPLSETPQGLDIIRTLRSLSSRYGRDPCSASRVAGVFNFFGRGRG